MKRWSPGLLGSLKHVLEPQALGISSQMAADCSCRPMGFLGLGVR